MLSSVPKIGIINNLTNWNAYIHFCDYQQPSESMGIEKQLNRIRKISEIEIDGFDYPRPYAAYLPDLPLTNIAVAIPPNIAPAIIEDPKTPSASR